MNVEVSHAISYWNRKQL